MIPLPIAPSRRLDGDFETVLEDLGLHRMCEIEAFSHAASGREQFVYGGEIHLGVSSVS